MNIQVMFTRENDPDTMSSAIMMRDKANFSHVLIVFVDDNGKNQIFHAVGKGVCVEDYDKYFETHSAPEIFDVELNVSRDYFMGFVRGMKGKEYSQSQLAAIAFGKTEDNGDEKMICSELVGIVLTEMAGKKIPGKQDSWRPIHCLKALKG